MNFIEEFFNQYGFNILDYENHDIELDHKYDENFNYVDGEEGDNGIIRYYHEDNLAVIRTIHGGDEEDIEFTEYGKNLFKYRAISLLNDYIIKLKNL